MFWRILAVDNLWKYLFKEQGQKIDRILWIWIITVFCSLRYFPRIIHLRINNYISSIHNCTIHLYWQRNEVHCPVGPPGAHRRRKIREAIRILRTPITPTTHFYGYKNPLCRNRMFDLEALASSRGELCSWSRSWLRPAKCKINGTMTYVSWIYFAFLYCISMARARVIPIDLAYSQQIWFLQFYGFIIVAVSSFCCAHNAHIFSSSY